MSAILEARGLTVSAHLGGSEVEVLRDIDFTLAPGRVLALVGESGAGKSMLGRVVGGALPRGFRVSRGSLAFDGRELTSAGADERRALLGERITFVPQEPLSALNPVRTIADQFDEHWARLAVPRAERRTRTLEALASVRLRTPEALLARYPFELSGGMCQRVLIALAFASRPALVIADEPTTALDVTTQAAVVGLMRELQRERGTALVFITHDLRLAARVADEVGVLYAGDLVEIGPAREVFSAPRHPYTRALQAANPPLTGPRRRLVTLPDQMPGLGALAALGACRFAPRCPNATAACGDAPSRTGSAGDGHRVRASDACRTVSRAERPHTPLTAPPPGAVVLDLAGVAKTYPARRRLFGPRGKDVEAVKPMNLTVRAGEFVGVVGESGSGKSTLAKLVIGLERPSAGTISIDGVDVTSGRPETRSVRLGGLQMVFQDPQSALNPRRPIERLVTQAMEARGAPEAERIARARALLVETGLPPELADRYPAQLSGGQKQRVNIARALCVTPRLLIADEIVSGLDVSVQAQILNLLLDLRADLGVGILFISHDLSVVRYLCERVIVMTEGAVVEEGPTETVLAAPRHPYTRALVASVPPDDPDAPWPA